MDSSHLLPNVEERDEPPLKRHHVTVDQAVTHIGLGSFHWHLLALCGLGWAADNMWMQALSLVIPIIQEEFGIDDDRIGLLGSMEFAGMAVGALVWGPLSDRIGRKIAFMVTLLIAGLFGMATAFSINFPMMLCFVFVLSFGVGGNMPVDGAMFTEFVPKKNRGKLSVLLSTFWCFGSVYAAVIGWAVLPRISQNYGWRLLYIVMAVTNLLIFVVRVGMPESPKFLVMKGRFKEASAVMTQISKRCGQHEEFVIIPDGQLEECADITPMNCEYTSDPENSLPPKDAPPSDLPTSMCSSPKFMFTTVLVLLIWIFTSYGFTSFNLFLPKMLKAKGVESKQGVYFSAVLYATAGIPGSLLGCLLVESFLGRRWTMALSTLLTGICGFTFTFLTKQWTLILFSCLIQLLSQIMFAGIYTYTPEVYPTTIRASAVGTAAGGARIAGVIAPIATGFIMKANLDMVFWVFAGCFAVASVSMAILPIETRGKSLN